MNVRKFVVGGIFVLSAAVLATGLAIGNSKYFEFEQSIVANLCHLKS